MLWFCESDNVFNTNIAGVAEFRSISDSQSEQNMHYVAAVLVMASFWCIHFIISICLKDKYYRNWTFKVWNCVYYCRTYDKAVCGGGGGQ
jgi:hypothetical protein